MTALGLVHRWEPGASPDTPVFLALHGTGGDEHDLVPLARDIAPEAAVLSPRGAVLENGMPRFFRRLAEGVFDLDDLRRRTDDLARFVRDAADTYGFAERPVYAVGFSNGANVAASLLLRHPGLLRAAVLYRAMVPFEPETAVSLAGTRVLLSEGRSDPIVPAANAERLAAILRDAGAEVTLRWQSASHQLVRQDLDVARAWLAGAPRAAT